MTVLPEQPHEVLWSLTNACFAARCLHVVAALGIADRLDEGSVPVGALAADCDPDAVDRVLRLLAAYGVFERTAEGYRHTPSSRLLRSDDSMSMRAFAQLFGVPLVWNALGELEHAVRTGRPGVEKFESGGFWAYLHSHPLEADVFGRAMAAKAGPDVAAVLSAYDFGRFPTVADIGGGRGHLLRAVLDATPACAGVLFDLPEVVETLDVGHPRMAATGGDFFVDALPAADVYLLMEVLHDWADEECVALLRAIRRAGPDEATVLVIEDMLSDSLDDPRASTQDIVMLAVTGGRERTPGQLSALFDRVGFGIVRVLDTAGRMRIVEARPV
jgi:C-methyltransferase